MHAYEERARYDDILGDVAAVERAHKLGFAHSIRRYLYAPDPLAAGETALDVGCGQGHGALVLAHKGYTVTGVDRCAPTPEVAAQDRVTIECAHVGTWEPTQRFDLVCLCDFLEHLQNPEGMLARVVKWAKPSGLLFTTIPIEGSESPNPWHVQAWTIHQVRAMLNERWQILAEMACAPEHELYAICRPKAVAHA